MNNICQYILDLPPDLVASVLISIGLTLLISQISLLRTRARVRVMGHGAGGSGQPDGMARCSISIGNDPQFLWMKINREPTEIISAWLMDERHRSILSNRTLVFIDKLGKYNHGPVTIGPGESLSISLFAKYKGEDTFFVANELDGDGKLIRSAYKFSGDRVNFKLWLRDRIGRTYKFKIFAINEPNGIQIFPAPDLTERWRGAMSAIRQLRSAIFDDWR